VAAVHIATSLKLGVIVLVLGAALAPLAAQLHTAVRHRRIERRV
jgi:hypothetical protein